MSKEWDLRRGTPFFIGITVISYWADFFVTVTGSLPLQVDKVNRQHILYQFIYGMNMFMNQYFTLQMYGP